MSKLKRYEWIGIIFTIVIGTVLHFVYDWSGNNQFVALFSPINESTWEHLKLLFFPYIIYSIIEFILIGEEYKNFITAKTLGLLSGLAAIPIIFYLYTAILSDNYLILDILTFIIGVLISYAVSSFILKNQAIEWNGSTFIVMIFLIIMFFIFTFHPPTLFLFEDPITHTYGI